MQLLIRTGTSQLIFYNIYFYCILTSLPLGKNRPDLLDKIPELERKITELENKLGTQVIYTLDGTTLNIDTK